MTGSEYLEQESMSNIDALRYVFLATGAGCLAEGYMGGAERIIPIGWVAVAIGLAITWAVRKDRQDGVH